MISQRAEGRADRGFELPRDAARVVLVLETCWSAATSSRWSAEAPSRGQCGVTALVLNDRFGGEILKTRVGDSWHYYNRVAGSRVDATEGQFAEPPAYTDSTSSRDEAQTDCTPSQYGALSRAFAAACLPSIRRRGPARRPGR